MHRMAWVSSDGKVIQLGMRLPLRVINIDFDKRFVDFAVAGRPTTGGTHVTSQRTTPAKKQGKPHSKPAAKAGPAAKVGPAAKRSRYHESTIDKSKKRRRK
jgi:hypothetical protein